MLVNLLVDARIDPYDSPLLASNSNCINGRLNCRKITTPMSIDTEKCIGVSVRWGKIRRKGFADGSRALLVAMNFVVGTNVGYGSC